MGPPELRGSESDSCLPTCFTCRKSAIIVGLRRIAVADVAQLAEQLICNQQVGSSILPVSSANWIQVRVLLRVPGGFQENWVGYPSGQREQTVNLPAYAYEGSNPSPTM